MMSQWTAIVAGELRALAGDLRNPPPEIHIPRMDVGPVFRSGPDDPGENCLVREVHTVRRVWLRERRVEYRFDRVEPEVARRVADRIERQARLLEMALAYGASPERARLIAAGAASDHVDCRSLRVDPAPPTVDDLAHDAAEGAGADVRAEPNLYAPPGFATYEEPPRASRDPEDPGYVPEWAQAEVTFGR